MGGGVQCDGSKVKMLADQRTVHPRTQAVRELTPEAALCLHTGTVIRMDTLINK